MKLRSRSDFDAARDMLARALGFGGIGLGAACLFRHAIIGA